jgi:hypothetical protein
MKKHLVATLALLVVVAGPAMAAAKADKEGGWRFAVTPIAAWAFNAKGPVTLLDHTRYTNASFGDISNNLNSAGGLGFQFGKGKWTGTFSASKLEWEVERVQGPGFDANAFDVNLDYTVVELGFAYRLATASGPKAPAVELLGFVRSSKIELGVEDSSGSGFSGETDVDWTDPFLGMRLVQPIKGAFFAVMSADIGGFGITSNQSQLTWDFLAGLGYRWKFDGWGMTLSGGYKAQQFVLRNETSPELFSLDQRFQGPTVALTFGW